MMGLIRFISLNPHVSATVASVLRRCGRVVRRIETVTGILLGEDRLRRQIALYLRVDLIGRRHVLRVHLRHYELAEHLNLLDLRKRQLIAHLNRL